MKQNSLCWLKGERLICQERFSVCTKLWLPFITYTRTWKNLGDPCRVVGEGRGGFKEVGQGALPREGVGHPSSATQ